MPIRREEVLRSLRRRAGASLLCLRRREPAGQKVLRRLWRRAYHMFASESASPSSAGHVEAREQARRTFALPARSRSAERRQVTVMFCDLAGSTALASRLDPEEMREVLRAFQNAVTGEIARLEGHVAKLMGDGVLAYFGWPRAHEDEAERAVRSGLAIGAAVARLRTPMAVPLAAGSGLQPV